MQIEWVHHVDFCVLKSGHYFCMHTLADKRTQWPTPFREWCCNCEANRHEICTKLRQRVKNKVSRIPYESVKSHSMKSTMMFKLDLKKNALTVFRTPVQNGLMKKKWYILHGKWTLACILCTHQNSYKLDKGIMLIFVSEKNRPLLLTKGVYSKHVIFNIMWYLKEYAISVQMNIIPNFLRQVTTKCYSSYNVDLTLRGIWPQVTGPQWEMHITMTS